RLAPTFKTHREHVADLRRRHGELNPPGGALGTSTGATLEFGLIKAVLAIIAIVFIWSISTKIQGDVFRELQPPKPVAASPQPQPRPHTTNAVAPQVSHDPSPAQQAPKPMYYHPK